MSVRMPRDADEAPVFRAPMRSREEDVPDGGAVDRALASGVCGIGGRLDPPPALLAEALTRIDASSGERAARRLERFAVAPVGAFVWTRDAEGFLWLGRITGGWRYDAAPAAVEVDLVHVRSCDWLDRPVPHEVAPPSVHVAFARGGRNWQRIRRLDAFPLSVRLWNDAR